MSTTVEPTGHAAVDALKALSNYPNRVANPLLTSDADLADTWSRYDLTKVTPYLRVKEVPITRVDSDESVLLRRALHAEMDRTDDEPDGKALEADGRFFLLDGTARVVAKWLQGDVTVFLQVGPAARIPDTEPVGLSALRGEVRAMADQFRAAATPPTIEVSVAAPQVSFEPVVRVPAPVMVPPSRRRLTVERNAQGLITNIVAEDAV